MQSSAIDLRPKNWDEVIGQDVVVNGIKNKLESGVPPAWLFIGEPGSGKTTISEILAHYIQGPSYSEYDEFLDIRRINAADKNGVDDARALAEECKYHPTYGKYRVIIMDEAHMLTPAAQNTLLIPTETANGSTVWIFCTTDPHKLIPALRSRCVTFEMKPFGRAQTITLISSIGGVTTEKQAEFVDAVTKNNLTNPREILYSWDKYVAGVPLDEAIVIAPDNNPVYTDISKYAAKGDWNRFSQLFNQLKSADVKGLKSVLAWQLKYKLLDSGINSPTGDAASEAVIRLGNLSAFEDGITLAAIAGIVYNFCKKVSR